MGVEISDEAIRDRAYYIWEAEGKPAGKDAEHWQQALQELTHEAQSANGGSAPAETGAPVADAAATEGEPKAKRAAPRSRAKKADTPEVAEAEAAAPADKKPRATRKTAAAAAEPASDTTDKPKRATRRKKTED